MIELVTTPGLERALAWKQLRHRVSWLLVLGCTVTVAGGAVVRGVLRDDMGVIGVLGAGAAAVWASALVRCLPGLRAAVRRWWRARRPRCAIRLTAYGLVLDDGADAVELEWLDVSRLALMDTRVEGRALVVQANADRAETISQAVPNAQAARCLVRTGWGLGIAGLSCTELELAEAVARMSAGRVRLEGAVVLPQGSH
ncbi:hypothetical protein FB474_0875 [Oryzihumus leptocrescens]|uniref:Uncharacterized protein n=1 Tax=Oryzihumus leptocrescens TaxID=297536 RepID=A0A542ZH70_9MICO|nr:hypothetical protein FB474_0875 [Oryzihumus leptocrescens]